MSHQLRRDIDLASKIALAFLKGQPVSSITPLIGMGSVNKIFIVEASDSKIVIRMRDGDAAATAAALREYQKEAWCIEQAAAMGVPGPEVLATGTRDGSAYMIQSYVSGEEGRESVVAKTHLWQRLGEYAKLIHSIKVAGFGLQLSGIRAGVAEESWLEYVGYNIESLNENDELLRLHVLSK